jgi:hypothetical protein
MCSTVIFASIRCHRAIPVGCIAVEVAVASQYLCIVAKHSMLDNIECCWCWRWKQLLCQRAPAMLNARCCIVVCWAMLTGLLRGLSAAAGVKQEKEEKRG